MLNTALQILASELALVMELDYAEAEMLVRSALQ